MLSNVITLSLSTQKNVSIFLQVLENSALCMNFCFLFWREVDDKLYILNLSAPSLNWFWNNSLSSLLTQVCVCVSVCACVCLCLCVSVCLCVCVSTYRHWTTCLLLCISCFYLILPFKAPATRPVTFACQSLRNSTTGHYARRISSRK